MAKWGRRGVLWHITNVIQSIVDFTEQKQRPQVVQWKGRQRKNKFTITSDLGQKPSSHGFIAKPVKSKKWNVKEIENMPRKKIKKRIIALWILIGLILFSIPAFIFIEKNLRHPLMNIAKIRIKQVATQAINEAITNQVAGSHEMEQLIDWKMNSQGQVSGFMLNYGQHMKITSSTINTVQQTLLNLHKIPEHIPIGHALNSAIISNYGPRIPVYFEPLGAVKVELNTRERNAGINMVLVEVYIKVVTEVSIIIPFDTEPEVVEAEIPISYLLVVGDVPMYYYDSQGKAIGESAPQAPAISVPLSPGVGISNSPSADAPVLADPSTESLPVFEESNQQNLTE